MTLIDDTYDCCGRRFDPMGDPLLIRGRGYDVFCHACHGGQTAFDKAAAVALRAAAKEARERGDIGCGHHDDCPTVWDWLEARANRIDPQEDDDD